MSSFGHKIYFAFFSKQLKFDKIRYLCRHREISNVTISALTTLCKVNYRVNDLPVIRCSFIEYGQHTNCHVNQNDLFTKYLHFILILLIPGIKTKLAESEIPVAFLNGDDKKEIEWVQNMSTQLKTKFDVNCAILAKDYLSGFPLRTSLRKYFNTFQAVLLTITKENHRLYEYFIEDDMPVIAVEIEHVNEICLNLRKCQYINCTTCEHLWFPRLIDIMKTKLPGELYIFRLALSIDSGY